MIPLAYPSLHCDPRIADWCEQLWDSRPSTICRVLRLVGGPYELPPFERVGQRGEVTKHPYLSALEDLGIVETEPIYDTLDTSHESPDGRRIFLRSFSKKGFHKLYRFVYVRNPPVYHYRMIGKGVSPETEYGHDFERVVGQTMAHFM